MRCNWCLSAWLLLLSHWAFADSKGVTESHALQHQQLLSVFKDLQRSVKQDFELSLLPKIRLLREQAKMLGMQETVADSLVLEGSVVQQYGAYKNSLSLHYEALTVAEKLNQPELLLRVYFAFVALELDLERRDVAERYMALANKLLRNKLLPVTYQIQAQFWHARVLLQRGSFREVQEVMLKQLHQTELTKAQRAEAILIYADALLATGDYRGARVALLELNDKLELLSTRALLQYHVLVAQCYLQAGDFDAANRLALTQLRNTFDTRYLAEQAQLQYILASSYAQQADYKQAHLYLKRAMMTERALNLQKRSNKVLQLEAQFSFAEQKKQLRLLEEDNAVQAEQLVETQQQLENARLAQQRWVLLGLLVLGICGFGYWRWQNKRYLVLLKQQVRERTSELAERNERLQALSFTDSLTGLRNRHYFFSVINGLMADIKERECIIALIDIDHFKRINDTYGHVAGDLILQSFADILKQCTRRSDIIVRWGGEEFLLLMPDMQREDVCDVIERIRLQVSSYPFLVNDHILTCTCSIGFAPMPLCKERPDWLNWEQALELADVSLYIAKEARRNAWLGVAQLLQPEEYANAELFTKQARTLIRKGALRMFASHSQVMLER
ncbi:diguanylate cyclase [Pseudoalteromonas fenneropenaei]|uniref:diguanylate cyclase n=1 Tax=Pseudoalteromonas fenneropenaei TaxID=1737459 RepID=A0ABV7CH28_9GAMM